MEKASSQEIEGGSDAILVAEDEPVLRDVLTHILGGLAYKVFSASGGLEAVTLFKEKLCEIDIVILDVAMPGMNRHEAYREIQTIKAGTPVIFMTGYSLDGVQANFILEEGFDVIRKPFTLISLGRKIREALRSKGQGNGNPPNHTTVIRDLELYFLCFDHTVDGEYFFEDIQTNGIINGNKSNFFTSLLP
jgi:CheY-like chemotaxis protein